MEKATNFFETLMNIGLILMPVSIVLGVSVADTLTGIIGLSFLSLSFLRRDFSWSREAWVKITLILWGYTSIRLLIDLDTLKANSSILLWPRFCLLALAYRSYIRQHSQGLKYLLISLGGAIVFLMGDLMLQLFSGYDILGRPKLGHQLTGPYKIPRAGMTLLLTGFPLLGFLWKKTQENFKFFLLYSLAVLLGGSIIFCTGERMAFLLYLLGCFAFWLYYLPIRPSLKGIACLGTIGTVLGIILFFGYHQDYLASSKNSPYLSRHLVKTVRNIAEFKEHIYGINVILSGEFFQRSPILGIGKRNFYKMCCEKYPQDPQRYCAHHPHNVYLEFLAEFGIIGAILFLAMLGAAVRAVFKNWQGLHHNPLYIGLGITLFLKIWPIAVTTSFFNAWAAIPFWMVFGWALGISASLKEVA